MKLFCGLGNPGDSYRGTRHNIGFEVIDRLDVAGAAEVTGATYRGWRIGADDREILVIKPATFVNRSGLAVIEAATAIDAAPEEIFVITDDYHLPLGALRIRKTGTAGGHNGLQSIIDVLGTADFPRLRLGIGPLPDRAEADRSRIPEFVLGRFEPEEEEIIDRMCDRAVEAIGEIINNRLEMAISRYNTTNPASDE